MRRNRPDILTLDGFRPPSSAPSVTSSTHNEEEPPALKSDEEALSAPSAASDDRAAVIHVGTTDAIVPSQNELAYQHRYSACYLCRSWQRFTDRIQERLWASYNEDHPPDAEGGQVEEDGDETEEDGELHVHDDDDDAEMQAFLEPEDNQSH
ncbi:hypothetical protein FE257_007409 [Aspergillus nanangensis]|uniref:Uncharacterized protein n=1 Tax=Aspergillus nanangensis TaxID=2582783 RepID=A0AAD4GU52_ASPNN|nr:hypothetical protein FE257_007409 [Aspergillus nanangensis]